MLRKVHRRPFTILTTEGYLTYKRYILRPVDEDSKRNLWERYRLKSVVPMDAYLGIDHIPFHVTCDMALRIVRCAITTDSYHTAERMMEEFLGIRISDDTIQRLVNFVGSLVWKRDQEMASKALTEYNAADIRASHVRGRIPNGSLTLYLQMDGAMFNTVGKGKEGSSWRENKLAVAFKSTDLIPCWTNNGELCYRIGKREYACSVDGIDDFRAQLVRLVMRNSIMEAHNVVIISDGAAWIRKTRELLFPFAIQILDLFHLKENVSKFAQHIFSNDKEKSVPWTKKVCLMLEDGKWRQVLEIDVICSYKEKETPPGIVNLYSYIWNNRDNIDYPTYKKRGYFVGSGAIESANKTVMQRRLKESGMRWRTDLARGVITLRCKLCSNLWDTEVVPWIKENYRKGR